LRQLLLIRRDVLAHLGLRELPRSDDRRDLRTAYAFWGVGADAFDKLGSILPDFARLPRNARFGERAAVRIEPVDARIVEHPLVDVELGTVGEDDLRRLVVAVVLNERYVQQ